MRPNLYRIAVLLAAILVAQSPAQAAAGEDPPSFEVRARRGRLTPERLEVPANRKLKLVLRNEGPGPLEFENLDLRVEKVLAPQSVSFVIVPPLKPGRYPFIDEFHPKAGTLWIIAR